MKKLALIISSVLLMSSQAFAAQHSDTFIVNAKVDNYCKVSEILSSNTNMESNANPNIPYIANIELKCNNSEGAKVKLSTKHGGFKHTTRDDISKIYGYTATLGLNPHENDLVLKATGVANAEKEQDITKATSITHLAAGTLRPTLTINNVEDMTPAVAGLYQDELTVSIVTL